MKKTKKAAIVSVAAFLLCALCACGGEEPQSLSYTSHPNETVETLAVITDVTTVAATTQAPRENVIYALEETRPQVVSTTVESTTTTTVPTTEATEDFQLTSELVAIKMHDFYSAKGYTDAQIAGIIANAEAETGLEPLRYVPDNQGHSWFGLFMLINCPRRDEMLAEFDKAGLGKYTTSEYWGRGASNFDSAEDFDKFMDIFLEYSMDPNDTAWMTEIQTADTPELAAEIFLVRYERAIGGSDQIEYYEPFKGLYYQGTEARRDFARKWYEYFTA